VEQLFDEMPSPDLRGFIIFVPMVKGDSPETAGKVSAVVKDPRIQCLWDPSGEVAHLFAPILGLKRKAAWDVYMLYRPGIIWNEASPPSPSFWMHQLKNEDDSRRLDREIFTTETKRLLRQRTVKQELK
jgi:hypothetical protein